MTTEPSNTMQSPLQKSSQNQASTPVITLEAPFGEKPKDLKELLGSMGNSWNTADTGTTGATGTSDDDTVDSRLQPKSQSRRGGRRSSIQKIALEWWWWWWWWNCSNCTLFFHVTNHKPTQFSILLNWYLDLLFCFYYSLTLEVGDAFSCEELKRYPLRAREAFAPSS